MKVIIVNILLIIFLKIKSVDFNEVINNLEILETYIKSYKSENNNEDSLTHLIVCYIREGGYTGTSWTIAGGSIPSDLPTYIQSQDSEKGTNAQALKTYREIELPNNEKFDFVHLFAVMNGIEYGGSYSSKFAHLVGWGGDTFQLLQDIKNENGSVEELINIAKNYFGIKGGFDNADLVSDLDAPILLSKKNDNNNFADIISNYYKGKDYENRINNFLKLTFPKLKYLDKFRKTLYDIYYDDTYIRILECQDNLRDGKASCLFTEAIKSQYKNHQKAAVYVFADYLAEGCSGYENSFSFKLNVSFMMIIINLLFLF